MDRIPSPVWRWMWAREYPSALATSISRHAADRRQGLQVPLVAIQGVLPDKQVPQGTSIIIFLQTFGGSIFISAAQSVFNNKLVSNIVSEGIPVDAGALLTQGATQITNLVEPKYLGALRLAYNESITQVCLRILYRCGLVFADWTDALCLRGVCFAEHFGKLPHSLAEFKEEKERAGSRQPSCRRGVGRESVYNLSPPKALRHQQPKQNNPDRRLALHCRLVSFTRAFESIFHSQANLKRAETSSSACSTRAAPTQTKH